MSFFEAGMIICFGAAWPVSIYKSYTSRQNGGKSLGFMLIILTGYISGLLHKFIYNLDPIIFLYLLNAVMVSLDILIYMRNQRLVRSAV